MFGSRPHADEKTPARTICIARAATRRTVMLKEAAEVIAHLPAEGEALHAITGRFDALYLLTALLDKMGPAQAVKIATLSFNGRNLQELVRLLDEGKIARLTALCSSFFRAHNRELYAEALDEFRQRGQRVAAGRNHCKIITVELVTGGKVSMEGSANLRTNSNAEQVAIIRDPSLHDFYARHIDDTVSRHEPENDNDEQGE
jgi:hypothetical protein